MHKAGYVFILVFIAIISVISYAPKISFSNNADGFAYYLPLRSFIYDRDFDFSNENTAYENTFHSLPYDWKHLSSTFLYIYPYSIGPSLFWSPFIILMGSRDNNVPLISPVNDIKNSSTGLEFLGGFTLRDQSALTLASRLYGLFSLILCYLLLLRFLPKNKFPAFFSVIITAAATPFFYYYRYQPLMSHVLSACAVSLFLFLWSYKIFQQRCFRFFYIGLGLGIVALVRWQDIIFILFPLTELVILFFRDNPKHLFNKSKLLFSLLFGNILAFLPQLVFWKTLYGTYFTIPQGGSYFRLSAPYLTEFLFSFRHGLFTWSPILVFSMFGLIIILVRKKPADPQHYENLRLFALCSVIVFLIAVYVNSSIIDWHGSDSFGARRMVSLFPIYSFGVYHLLSILQLKLKFILFIILIFFAVYNFLFSSLFFCGSFDHYKEINPIDVLNKVNDICPIRIL